MFNDDTFYSPHDLEMRFIASVSRLAQWRCSRQGPPFYKLRRRIWYKGSDLNRFIAARRVETAGRRPGANLDALANARVDTAE